MDFQVEAKNRCIEVVVAQEIEKKQVKVLGSHQKVIFELYPPLRK
jgi:hypothetical protein